MPQALNEMANSEEAIVREAVGEVSQHCYYTIFIGGFEKIGLG